MTKVMVSGGFDPVHIGHLRMCQEAKKLGDYLVVVVHCNDWLVQKKGFYFMDEKERCEIMKGFACVDEVYLHKGMERSAISALKAIKPDVYANGGDRDEKDAADPNSPLCTDVKVCEELDIKMVFGVGGGKIQSSSDLIKKLK